MRFCSRIYTLLLCLLMLLTSSTAQAQNELICWKGNYTRGAGSAGNRCPSGMRDNGAGLCIGTCEAGYKEVANVCWQESCPAGFGNHPATCWKPDALRRSFQWEVGDPLDLSAAESRCREGGRYSCYQAGLIIYRNCPSGYRGSGGETTCSPECPNGMSDGGLFCNKRSYSLPTPRIPSCSSGMDSDAGLCYPSCGAGFSGVGPVCWGSCPADFPVQCGAACAKSSGACAAAIGDMTFNTTAVALNVLSFAFGGPGVTTAVKSAAKQATSSATDTILRTTSQSAVDMILTAAKQNASGFAKSFVKETVKNQFDPMNLYWKTAKQVNASGLRQMNKAATEFGILKESNAFDLNSLTALDPTGISGMVTSFTKYPSCAGEPFLVVGGNEFDFGYLSQRTETRNIDVVAQRSMTITRVTSPALSNCAITPESTCIGRQLMPGESCRIKVTVDAKDKALDSELRIYTDEYNTIPYPLHITANSGAVNRCAVTTGVDEAVNLTSIAGVWAYNKKQNQKLVVEANGNVKIWTGTNGQASVLNADSRAFTIATGTTKDMAFLDELGDVLTFVLPPVPGTITAVHSKQVLDIPNGAKQPGVQPVQWPSHGGINQMFLFDPLGDGTYRIVSLNSTLVLEVEGASTATGARILQAVWNGGKHQKFRLELVGSNFRIRNVNSGKVLNVSGGNSTTGSPLIQWDAVGADNELFILEGAARITAVRRPWDSRCEPGKTWFAGLCYDVPYGYSLTAAGIMGKTCPANWRDDGTSCWPAWTGPVVAAQADPNGNSVERYPLLVTDCGKYGNGQSCPTGFERTACTCVAKPTSKSIEFIGGSMPIR